MDIITIFLGVLLLLQFINMRQNDKIVNYLRYLSDQIAQLEVVSDDSDQEDGEQVVHNEPESMVDVKEEEEEFVLGRVEPGPKVDDDDKNMTPFKPIKHRKIHDK